MAIIVSDHAVVRYLERKYGIQVELIRREIAALPGLAPALKAGATRISLNGMTFIMRDDTVITCSAATSPFSSRMKAAKNKHGRSVRDRGLANNSHKQKRLGTKSSRPPAEPTPEDHDDD